MLRALGRKRQRPNARILSFEKSELRFQKNHKFRMVQHEALRLVGFQMCYYSVKQLSAGCCCCCCCCCCFVCVVVVCLFVCGLLFCGGGGVVVVWLLLLFVVVVAFFCFFFFLLLLFFFAFFLVFVVVLVSFIDIRCRVDIRKISLMSFIPKDFEEKEAAAPLAWWQGLCVFVLLCPVWLLPFFAL